ncbi:hypothetical protein VKT23_015110 [Stygiomarasmius scandens]|uniref:F-box domain-containing protein n=1 Tax=Marasmiellus scandens TaxID=2682957 RepID=A0ABR1IYK3_9AGAR
MVAHLLGPYCNCTIVLTLTWQEDNIIVLCNSCQVSPPIKFYGSSSSSDFKLLRETNAYSTPQSLELVSRDINWLAVEAQRLKDVVRELEQQHENANRYRDLIVSSFAPINRAPTEVLAEIFCLYCEDELIPDRLPLGYAHPAYLLSAVCFRWRNIVENSPKIWSHISASDQLFTSSLLTHCLTLSRQAPLHIDISFHPNYTLLEQLFQQSNRWQSLRMELPSRIASTFTKFLADSSKSQRELFPILRRINVFCPDLYIQTDLGENPLPTSLPQLREFSFSCQRASRPSDSSPTLFVDRKITCLEVCDQLHDEDLVFLNSLTSLKRLYLRQYLGSSPTDEKIYRSSSLYHLVIRVHIHLLASVNLTLFSRLTLPGLTSLEISQFGVCREETVWNSSSFISMIQRSSCTLQSLYLEEVQIGFEDLKTLLRAVPTLENFTLIENSQDKAKSTTLGFKLAVLLVWRAFSPLLPRLKDLELRVYSVLDDVLLDVIRDLIISRTSPNAAEAPLRENLTYFRYHPLCGAVKTFDEDPDLVMRNVEKQVKANIPSGVSFCLVLPPEEISESESGDHDADDVISDDSSVVVTDDSDYDQNYWEDDEEEEGETDILHFDPGVSSGGEILFEQYYMALQQ